MEANHRDNPAALRRWLRIIAAALLLPVAYMLSRPLTPAQVAPWNPLVLGYTVVMLAACGMLAGISVPLFIISFSGARDKMARRLRKFAALCASILLALVALDVIIASFPALEVWYRLPDFGINELTPSIMVDQELGFKGKPHQSIDFVIDLRKDSNAYDWVKDPVKTNEPEDGMRVSWKLDKDGFFNDSVPDTCNMAVIGDSICCPIWIPPAQCWPQALARDTDFTCYNAAFPAYTYQQELIVLKRYVIPKKPKVVFWTFYQGNDFLEAEMVQQEISTKSNCLKMLRKWYDTPKPFPYNRPLVNLLLYAAGYKPSARPASTPPYPGPGTLKVGGVEKPVIFRNYFLYPLSLPRYTIENSPAWCLLRESLEQAKAECDKIGARLIVIYMPEKLTVFGMDATSKFDKKKMYEFARPTLAGLGDVGPDDFIRMLQENLGVQLALLKDTCEKSGMEMIDMTAPLRASLLSGEWPYFCYDIHLNMKGHEVVASAVRDYLRAHPVKP